MTEAHADLTPTDKLAVYTHGLPFGATQRGAAIALEPVDCAKTVCLDEDTVTWQREPLDHCFVKPVHDRHHFSSQATFDPTPELTVMG